MASTGSARTSVPYKGLTSAEVVASRAKHGANVLTPPKRDPWWKLWFEKFDDPVIRILMIAAVLAIGVGVFEHKYYEGVGIIAAILLATFIAFVNEFKAGKAFDILNRTTDEKKILTLRDGTWVGVPRKDIVVGDVIELLQGYEVPADGNVLESVSLQINQASLTGETYPRSKYAEGDPRAVAKPGEEEQYPSFKVYRGTTVTGGHGIIRIQAVGDGTEFGRIVRETTEEEEGEGQKKTPLNQQLERLSKWIGVFGFGFAAITFLALVVRGWGNGDIALTGRQWVFAGILLASSLVALVKVWAPIVYDAFGLVGREAEPPAWLGAEGGKRWMATVGAGLLLFCVATAIAYAVKVIPAAPADWLPLAAGDQFLKYFMIAVTIIVVAVPEGLAMSVTLSLAYSMSKMTKANTLVRKMDACETIGAATVICSDKTGTLTTNQMVTRAIVSPCPAGETCEAKGSFACGPSPRCRQLLSEGIAANTTAHLSRQAGREPRPIGDPTEGAILVWLDGQGIEYETARASFRREDQLSFDTGRKFMATLGTSSLDGVRRLHVKGAPEIVIERCNKVFLQNRIQPLSDSLRKEIVEQLRQCQQIGLRALGFAFRDDLEGLSGGGTLEEGAHDLVWIRFVAIEDPIRQDVPAAVQACHLAGIDVKIVTGDHPETAKEIGRQIGVIDSASMATGHLSGMDFERLSEEDAEKRVDEIKVLSRSRPANKKQFVEMLRKKGHVVAVTGDGVNDCPALSHADVGLAMGSGTDAAKEVSQIVLLNDSFATIRLAVMWGRSLYQNIQRFILFQLTVNVAALTVALLGPFLGIKFPLTVVQMLWVNLIMDTFAALALAAEPPHEDVMKAPPRRPADFIVTKAMAKNIFLTGMAFVVVLLGYLVYIKRKGTVLSDDVPSRELTIFFVLFVMLQFWNLFNARMLGLAGSALSGFWRNRGFLLIVSAIFICTVAMVQIGGNVFRTVPLSLRDWVVLVAGTSTVLWIGEIGRLLTRAKRAA